MARALPPDHPDWVPDQLAPVRGILFGLALSIPIWLLLIGVVLIIVGHS